LVGPKRDQHTNGVDEQYKWKKLSGEKKGRNLKHRKKNGVWEDEIQVLRKDGGGAFEKRKDIIKGGGGGVSEGVVTGGILN